MTKQNRILGFYVFILILVSQITAMDAPETTTEPTNNKILFINVQPWQDNAKEYTNTADFVHWDAEGKPQNCPRFHHLDHDDRLMRSSPGKFSEFAAKHQEEYGMIILDWGVFFDIKRDEAFFDCLKLLKTGGKLVIPLSSLGGGLDKTNGLTTLARQKIELVTSEVNLSRISVDQLNYKDLLNPQNLTNESYTVFSNFLRREGGESSVTGVTDQVIFVATKKASFS